MTGEYNGAITKLEELLGRPLQWFICLLHCIELPLRHVFLLANGTSTASDLFSGPIKKKLFGKESDWVLQNLRTIKKNKLPIYTQCNAG